MIHIERTESVEEKDAVPAMRHTTTIRVGGDVRSEPSRRTPSVTVTVVTRTDAQPTDGECDAIMAAVKDALKDAVAAHRPNPHTFGGFR